MSLQCPRQMPRAVKAAPCRNGLSASEALVRICLLLGCLSRSNASLHYCRRWHSGDAAAGSCGRHAPGGRARHGAACNASTLCGKHLGSRPPL